MPHQLDNTNGQLDQADRHSTLWEAMGKLHEIQTQEKIALDKGDIKLFRQLLDQQAKAWKIVYVHYYFQRHAGGSEITPLPPEEPNLFLLPPRSRRGLTAASFRW